jgi:hypothetical protein
MTLGALKNIGIAENTVHSKEVLILKVASAAPLKNLYAKGVFTNLYKGGNIEFGLKMRALSKAYVFSVYINEVNLAPSARLTFRPVNGQKTLFAHKNS